MYNYIKYFKYSLIVMDPLDSLRYYAIIKYTLLFIGLCCICSCTSFIYYNMLSKHYIRANNAKVNYKHFSNNIPTENCSINAPEVDCIYVNEYDAKNMHYTFPYKNIDIKTPPTIGTTSIYFEDKNPQNYIISFIDPTNIPLIILYVVTILLFGVSINLLLIYLSKTYAAITSLHEGVKDVKFFF